MAFHFFLSLLPLLAFVGYVLGLVAQRKGASVVLGLVLHNAPRATEAVLQEEVLRLASADQVGPLAAMGFLWIASGGIQGLMQAIERVVGAPRRPWIEQRLLAIAWVIATLVAFAIASLGVVEWDAVAHATGDGDVAAASASGERRAVSPPPDDASGGRAASPMVQRAVRSPARSTRSVLRSGGERVMAMGTSLAIAVGGLGLFYRFAVAHTRPVRRRVIPGAAVAIALVLLVSWGFGLYVRTLASYTVYYGGLAAIAVLLVWLWLMSLAILVGAEFNAQLEGLRDEEDSGARS